jgi:hypothetical protein
MSICCWHDQQVTKENQALGTDWPFRDGMMSLFQGAASIHRVNKKNAWEREVETVSSANSRILDLVNSSSSSLRGAAHSRAIMISLRSLLAAALLVRAAFGICEIECIGVSSLLSDCSLPPLSTRTHVLRLNSARRNISGLSDEISAHIGPVTYGIETYAQARCFCLGYFTNRPSCETCFSQKRPVPSLEELDPFDVLKFYGYDCLGFGYFNNPTLAYPSTTRTEMPVMTSPPNGSGEEDEGESEDVDCADICGAIEAQIDQCSLISLNADPPPSSGSLMSNRTAAECICTLPMLRRFPGCNLCLGPESYQRTLLNRYQSGCSTMGYWGEPPYVLPEPEDMFSPRTTPTPTATARPNGGVKVPCGCLALGSAAMLSILHFLV